MLCFLEQKDDRTPPTRMALTLRTPSLCSEDSCKTKPISPGGPRGSKTYETNPILRLRIGDYRALLAMTCCGSGQACRGAAVRTNPIRRNELRQTNPISAAGKEEASALRERTYGTLHNRRSVAKQSQFRSLGRLDAGASCTNKPNSRRCADPEIGVPGRQIVRHRLGAPLRETKPIRYGRPGWVGGEAKSCWVTEGRTL